MSTCRDKLDFLENIVQCGKRKDVLNGPFQFDEAFTVWTHRQFHQQPIQTRTNSLARSIQRTFFSRYIRTEYFYKDEHCSGMNDSIILTFIRKKMLLGGE